jgi:hypothetical protein
VHLTTREVSWEQDIRSVVVEPDEMTSGDRASRGGDTTDAGTEDENVHWTIEPGPETQSA